MKKTFLRAATCIALMAGLTVSLGCGVGLSADKTSSTKSTKAR